MFVKWNPNRRYSEHTAPGWIPQGTKVKFDDNATGVIINGNSYRSLVEYHPKSGGGWTREWFDNETLKIAQ